MAEIIKDLIGYFKEKKEIEQRKEDIFSLFKETEGDVRKEFISSLPLGLKYTEEEIEDILITKRKEIIQKTVEQDNKCEEKKVLSYLIIIIFGLSFFITAITTEHYYVAIFLSLLILWLVAFLIVSYRSIKTCSCDYHLLLKAINENDKRKTVS